MLVCARIFSWRPHHVATKDQAMQHLSNQEPQNQVTQSFQMLRNLSQYSVAIRAIFLLLYISCRIPATRPHHGRVIRVRYRSSWCETILYSGIPGYHNARALSLFLYSFLMEAAVGLSPGGGSGSSSCTFHASEHASSNNAAVSRFSQEDTLTTILWTCSHD